MALPSGTNWHKQVTYKHYKEPSPLAWEPLVLLRGVSEFRREEGGGETLRSRIWDGRDSEICASEWYHGQDLDNLKHIDRS